MQSLTQWVTQPSWACRCPARIWPLRWAGSTRWAASITGEGHHSLTKWGFAVYSSCFVPYPPQTAHSLLSALAGLSTCPPPRPAQPSIPLIRTGWGTAALLPPGQLCVWFHLLQLYFLWVIASVVAHSLALFLGSIEHLPSCRKGLWGIVTSLSMSIRKTPSGISLLMLPGSTITPVSVSAGSPEPSPPMQTKREPGAGSAPQTPRASVPAPSERRAPLLLYFPLLFWALEFGVVLETAAAPA